MTKEVAGIEPRAHAAAPVNPDVSEASNLLEDLEGKVKGKRRGQEPVCGNGQAQEIWRSPRLK